MDGWMDEGWMKDGWMDRWMNGWMDGWMDGCIGRGVETFVSIAGHFDLFSLLLSCSLYTLYTAQFQFTGHSLDLLENVLYDWLFPHHCA